MMLAPGEALHMAVTGVKLTQNHSRHPRIDLVVEPDDQSGSAKVRVLCGESTKGATLSNLRGAAPLPPNHRTIEQEPTC